MLLSLELKNRQIFEQFMKINRAFTYMTYNQTFNGQMAQIINNAKIWNQCLWSKIIGDASCLERRESQKMPMTVRLYCKCSW